MARPTDRARHPLSEAVIELRRSLEENQQQFANRLELAMTTVARWETNRIPTGAGLAKLARVATDNGRADLSIKFLQGLGTEMGLSEFKGGFLSVDHSSGSGYLIEPLSGKRDADHATAFFLALARTRSPKPEVQEQAVKALDAFANAVLRKGSK